MRIPALVGNLKRLQKMGNPQLNHGFPHTMGNFSTAEL
jgi:hypothetical protein